jgi:hypothetical protein
MMQFVIGFILGFVIATFGVDKSLDMAKEGISDVQTEIRKFEK